MAHFHRFEVYLPVIYRVVESDPTTGTHTERTVTTNPETVSAFKLEAVARFGGATHAHPLAHSPFLGMWSNEHGQIAVDDVTYLFVLVPEQQFQDAIDFFDGWRQRFVNELKQDAILIAHWPVETIGEIS